MYKGDTEKGQLVKSQSFVPISDVITNGAITINVFGDGNVPESILGSVAQAFKVSDYYLVKAQGGKLDTKSIDGSITYEASKKSSEMIVYFYDKDNNNKFECSEDYYYIGANYEDTSKYNKIPTDCIISDGNGNSFKFNSIIVKDLAKGDNVDIVAAKVFFSATTNDLNQADMTLKVEMRLPKEGTDCNTATEIKSLSSANFEKTFRLLREMPTDASKTSTSTQEETKASSESVYVDGASKTNGIYLLDYSNSDYYLVISVPSDLKSKDLTAKVYFGTQEIQTLTESGADEFIYELFSSKSKLELNKDVDVKVSLFEGNSPVKIMDPIKVRLEQKCGQNKEGICQATICIDPKQIIEDYSFSGKANTNKCQLENNKFCCK